MMYTDTRTMASDWPIFPSQLRRTVVITLRYGVVEYLVLLVEEREVRWFYFPDDEIRPNREGISRSRVFPGFWVDIEALLRRDSVRLLEVLQQGLTSRPHAGFARRLQTAHRRRSK